MQVAIAIALVLLVACKDDSAPGEGKEAEQAEQAEQAPATTATTFDAAGLDAAVAKAPDPADAAPVRQLTRQGEHGLIVVGELHSSEPHLLTTYDQVLGDTEWDPEQVLAQLQGLHAEEVGYPKFFQGKWQEEQSFNVYDIQGGGITFIEGSGSIEYQGRVGLKSPCWLTIEVETPTGPKSWNTALVPNKSGVRPTGGPGIWRSGSTTYICSHEMYVAVVSDGGECTVYVASSSGDMANLGCEVSKIRGGKEVQVNHLQFPTPIPFSVRGATAKILPRLIEPRTKPIKLADMDAARKAAAKWRESHKETLTPIPKKWQPVFVP